MNRSLRITLVLLALGAGGIAAVARTPQPPLAADEVSATELAGWIRDRRPGLLVVDTRGADVDKLPGARGPDAQGDFETVVAYGERDLHDASLETLRKRFGNVLRLHGGVEAWNEDVLFPVIRGDASERQQRGFAPRAKLSRYFGGSPRIMEPGVARGKQRSRRGC